MFRGNGGRNIFFCNYVWDFSTIAPTWQPVEARKRDGPVVCHAEQYVLAEMVYRANPVDEMATKPASTVHSSGARSYAERVRWF